MLALRCAGHRLRADWWTDETMVRPLVVCSGCAWGVGWGGFCGLDRALWLCALGAGGSAVCVLAVRRSAGVADAARCERARRGAVGEAGGDALGGRRSVEGG